VQALLEASFPPVSNNRTSGNSGSSSSALSTSRTSLFSLGTAAAYFSCRQSLVGCSPSLQDLVAAVRGGGGSASSSGTGAGSEQQQHQPDEVLNKYLVRLKGKLSQQPAPERRERVE